MNFTAQQLRQQLKDGVKPVNDSSNDLNSLLETALKSVMKGTDVLETKLFAVLPGTHGMWRGLLNEVAFGVLLDTNAFQKYKGRRFRFTPDGLPESVEDWTAGEQYSDSQFYYIVKGNNIFIVLDLQ